MVQSEFDTAYHILFLGAKNEITGFQTRDYIFVKDIIKANLSVLDEIGDNQIFNLGSGKEVSDFEIFSSVRNSVEVDVCPNFADVRKGEAKRVVLSVKKAKEILKWEPNVLLDKGILEVVKNYKK